MFLLLFCLLGVDVFFAPFDLADNTTVFVAGTSIADILATLSTALTAAYGLRLNVAKTKCMLLHSSWRIPISAQEVQLNSHTIDRVQRYKFLGVIITDTLSWSDHIGRYAPKYPGACV